MTRAHARRLWMSALVAAVATIVGEGDAVADCHVNGVDSGTSSTLAGPSGSYQSYQWSLAGRSAYTLSSTGPSIPTNKCVDARFDWMTTAGHYDARVSRNCRWSSSRGGTFAEPAGWAGVTVTGLQKAAGCVYTVGSTTPTGCLYVSGSVPGCLFSLLRGWTHPSQAV